MSTLNEQIIYDRLKRIEDKLDNLIEATAANTKSCSRMDGHINFVEKTYQTLKNPLTYIASKFGKVSEQAAIEEKQEKQEKQEVQDKKDE
jgi:archaellum component FlaC